MDISLAIEKLVPGAEYFGSVTANNQEAYEKLDWKDRRRKPNWKAIVAIWPVVEAEQEANQPETIEALIERKISERVKTEALKNDKPHNR